jgi:ribosomal protein S12 methylthiotransferase accessory factor
MTLCPGSRPFDADRPIAWVQGYDLLAKEPCWVPAEIVHTDYAQARPDGFFLAGTNGLAAGNTVVEAVNAALYEVVERDAVALWAARPLERQAAGALDLGSVADADCRALLARYEAASIAVRVWDVTSDLGIAAFLCEIRDQGAHAALRPHRFHGAGCHADRGVALARALTEAAQTRLTYIAGIRDDLAAAGYGEPPGAEIADALLDALARAFGGAAFAAVPTHADDDLAGDLRWILGRLAGCGIARAIAVDLTRAEFAVPVVRLVVPGLEWDPHHPNYRPGARARAQSGG